MRPIPGIVTSHGAAPGHLPLCEGRARAAAPALRGVVVAIACAAGFPSVAAAQTIHGAVRDHHSGAPVAGATLMLADARDSIVAVTLTGEDGTYLLRSVPGDTVRVRAERVGYRPMASQLLVLATESRLELEVRLTPSPVVLPEVTATAQRRRENRTAFARRREREVWGRFADAEKLSRIRSPRAVDRLRPLIPGMLVSEDGVVRIRRRGAELSGSQTCEPRLVIDGVRYPGDVSLEALLSGDMIRAVEYYSDPQFAPAEFSTGFDASTAPAASLYGPSPTVPGLRRPCAIIVIWTPAGFGPDFR